MQLWEIVLIGAALSCDAFAAGVSNAVREPHMSVYKAAGMALTYALFQFAMPLLGYFAGASFSSLVSKIAPWLSFALLCLLGGKALFEVCTEGGTGERFLHKRKGVNALQIFVQGVATSLDALAVGVALLAQQMSGGLPVSVFSCAALIGATTACLSVCSVALGRAAGERFQGGAQFWGGAILVIIGVKILLEGVL